MPTSLPRVQVTFSKETHSVLKKLAKGKSLSKVVVELVHIALELKKMEKGNL